MDSFTRNQSFLGKEQNAAFNRDGFAQDSEAPAGTRVTRRVAA